MFYNLWTILNNFNLKKKNFFHFYPYSKIRKLKRSGSCGVSLLKSSCRRNRKMFNLFFEKIGTFKHYVRSFLKPKIDLS